MLKGRAKKQNWWKFCTNKFFFGNEMSDAECGAYALYTLTKRPYKDIIKLSKKEHWPDSTMFTYLRKHDYEIYPVTLGNIVECHKNLVDKNIHKITRKHVLLIEQKAIYCENTWSVLYFDTMAHSGTISPISTTEFLNYPPRAVYCIWHKKWK